MNNYPSKVSFHYPIKCNLQCRQCNLWKFQFTKSRLWKYKKSIILKLYNWIGKFTLSLTGGEPFLIKDFVDFLFFCDKLGIETSVNSNATLIDEKLAFKLSKLKYFNLTISLDGPNAKTHDYLRGVKGTFNKAKKAIKLLNKNGFNKLTMNTILSKKNIGLIEEILFFSKKNKIKIMFVPVVLNRFRNNLKNKKEFENHELWPNKNLALKKINKIISFKKKPEYSHLIVQRIEEFENFKKYFSNPFGSDFICNVDTNLFTVKNDGTVHICNSLNKPIGNIFKSSPKQIFESKERKLLISEIKKCHLPCKALNCYRKKYKRNYFKTIINVIKKTFN